MLQWMPQGATEGPTGWHKVIQVPQTVPQGATRCHRGYHRVPQGEPCAEERHVTPQSTKKGAIRCHMAPPQGATWLYWAPQSTRFLFRILTLFRMNLVRLESSIPSIATFSYVNNARRFLASQRKQSASREKLRTSVR